MKMPSIGGLPSLDSFSFKSAAETFDLGSKSGFTAALSIPEISLPKVSLPKMTAPDMPVPSLDLAQATRNAPSNFARFESRDEAFQFANNLADRTPPSQFVGIMSQYSDPEFGGSGGQTYRVLAPLNYDVDSNGVAILESAETKMNSYQFGIGAGSTQAIIRGREID
jgi:hypothetical protein